MNNLFTIFGVDLEGVKTIFKLTGSFFLNINDRSETFINLLFQSVLKFSRRPDTFMDGKESVKETTLVKGLKLTCFEWFLLSPLSISLFWRRFPANAEPISKSTGKEITLCVDIFLNVYRDFLIFLFYCNSGNTDDKLSGEKMLFRTRKTFFKPVVYCVEPLKLWRKSIFSSRQRYYPAFLVCN